MGISLLVRHFYIEPRGVKSVELHFKRSQMSYFYIGNHHIGKTASIYSNDPILKSVENGSHFADDILKCMFINENPVFWLINSLAPGRFESKFR